MSVIEIETGEREAVESVKSIVYGMAAVDGDKSWDGYADPIQGLLEWPLEVSVRSGWGSPYEPLKPEQFQILLMWGGPSVRITGSLDDAGGVYDARVEYRHWFQRWEYLLLDDSQQAAVERFAGMFFD